MKFFTKKLPSDQFKVSLDIVLSGTLLVTTGLVFCFGITWTDELSIKIAIVLALAIGLINTFKTVSLDFWMDSKEAIVTIVWTGINLGMIIFTHFIVKVTFPTVNSSITDPTAILLIKKLSASFVGVSEEMLFAAFIYPYFFRMFGGFVPLVLFISSVFFMVFHFFVYGGSFLTLLIVAVSRAVLSASVWQTKRITPAVLAHVGWNFVIS